MMWHAFDRIARHKLGRMMMVVPLVAILILDARPYQIAILGGATTTAGLMFGLITGPWIDRSKRRMVLVISDLSSAATPATVAIAHFFFELHIESLHSHALEWLAGHLQRSHPTLVLAEPDRARSFTRSKLEDGSIRFSCGKDRI
jgi:MFS family permease